MLRTSVTIGQASQTCLQTWNGSHYKNVARRICSTKSSTTRSLKTTHNSFLPTQHLQEIHITYPRRSPTASPNNVNNPSSHAPSKTGTQPPSGCYVSRYNWVIPYSSVPTLNLIIWKPSDPSEALITTKHLNRTFVRL
jgi:hypothetical protein